MVEGADGEPVVLPIGEMVYERWDDSKRPRIVGYAAKWDENTLEYHDTTRMFGWHRQEPALNAQLHEIAKACWRLCGLNGYARVDLRVDGSGKPFILEVNPNPCLEPKAGLACSYYQTGASYEQLIEDILRAARR